MTAKSKMAIKLFYYCDGTKGITRKQSCYISGHTQAKDRQRKSVAACYLTPVNE